MNLYLCVCMCVYMCACMCQCMCLYYINYYVCAHNIFFNYATVHIITHFTAGVHVHYNIVPDGEDLCLDHSLFRLVKGGPA